MSWVAAWLGALGLTLLAATLRRRVWEHLGALRRSRRSPQRWTTAGGAVGVMSALLLASALPVLLASGAVPREGPVFWLLVLGAALCLVVAASALTSGRAIDLDTAARRLHIRTGVRLGGLVSDAHTARTVALDELAGPTLMVLHDPSGETAQPWYQSRLAIVLEIEGDEPLLLDQRYVRTWPPPLGSWREVRGEAQAHALLAALGLLLQRPTRDATFVADDDWAGTAEGAGLTRERRGGATWIWLGPRHGSARALPLALGVCALGVAAVLAGLGTAPHPAAAVLAVALGAAVAAIGAWWTAALVRFPTRRDAVVVEDGGVRFVTTGAAGAQRSCSLGDPREVALKRTLQPRRVAVGRGLAVKYRPAPATELLVRSERHAVRCRLDTDALLALHAVLRAELGLGPEPRPALVAEVAAAGRRVVLRCSRCGYHDAGDLAGNFTLDLTCEPALATEAVLRALRLAVPGGAEPLAPMAHERSGALLRLTFHTSVPLRAAPRRVELLWDGSTAGAVECVAALE